MSRLEELRILLRRSIWFLEEAREAYRRGRFDTAVFLAEQSLQLYLKALLLCVLGDYPRSHSVRQLLSMLARALGRDAEERVAAYMRAARARLSELEDVYIAARCTPRVYTREDAEEILATVEEVMRLARSLLRGAAPCPLGEEEDAGGVEEACRGGGEGG